MAQVMSMKGNLEPITGYRENSRGRYHLHCIWAYSCHQIWGYKWGLQN